MNLRVRDFPDRGALLWFALTAGIVAWIAHLVFFASIVEFVNDNGYFWLFHVGNVVCIALAGDDDDEEDPTPEGRMRFLGLLGMASNGINLLLILFEGSYIFFIGTGRA
jgi:hypothetical protein